MHSFTNNIYYHGINRSTKWSCQTETYLEPCQISKMECFAKIINGFQPLTIFARRSILDVLLCQTSRDATARLPS